jgi:hypothetical protein
VEGESSHVLVCVLFLPRVVPRRSPFVSVPLGTIGEGQQPRYHWLPLGFKGVVPPAIQPRLSPRRLSSSLASSTAVLSAHSVPFDRWYQGRTEQNAVVFIATKIRGETREYLSICLFRVIARSQEFPQIYRASGKLKIRLQQRISKDECGIQTKGTTRLLSTASTLLNRKYI